MASAEKRLTDAEITSLHQQACREIPCAPARDKRPICPFCPHRGKR